MKRLSIDYIRLLFELEGYELLETNYKNGNQRLSYVCPKGHPNSISYYNWHAGSRCPDCFNEGRKLSIDYIKKELFSKGYVLLTNHYINNKQKLKCVCSKGHVCDITWATWVHRESGCRRCQYLNMSIRQSGAGNPNWLGGVSIEPYCEIWRDKDYKKSILKRDGYVCQDCGITNLLSMKVFGRQLTIHHIDYDKKNCNPGNLISLCCSCNTKANYNRVLCSENYSSKLRKEFYNKVKRAQ